MWSPFSSLKSDVDWLRWDHHKAELTEFHLAQSEAFNPHSPNL